MAQNKIKHKKEIKKKKKVKIGEGHYPTNRRSFYISGGCKCTGCVFGTGHYTDFYESKRA